MTIFALQVQRPASSTDTSRRNHPRAAHCDLAVDDFRPVDGEDVLRVQHAVVHVAQPRDRPHGAGIDDAVLDEAVIDVDADDSADDHGVARGGIGRLAGQLDRLPELALEGGRRFLDARRFDQLARGRRQAGQLELVDAVRHGRRRDVHFVAQVPVGERTDELAGLVDVAQAIFQASRREDDVMGVLAHGIEEAVGRDVGDAGLGDGRDPADRARHHQRLEGVVLEAVLILDGVIEHGVSSLCPDGAGM